MGSITSRQNAAVEEADISANHAYKYPPRAGKLDSIVKFFYFHSKLFVHIFLWVFGKHQNMFIYHVRQF